LRREGPVVQYVPKRRYTPQSAKQIPDALRRMIAYLEPRIVVHARRLLARAADQA
jgi:hypothetical protein